MKKSMLLLSFLSLLSFSYGQETVFFESCGNSDVTSAKKVDLYTGWDNSSPVTFSRTTTLDGAADVRITSTTTNHVWFPSGKSTDLIISDIPVTGFTHLKLSFDLAAYKLTDANANKLNLYCNNSILTVPFLTFSTSKFITIPDIELENSENITLKFKFTAENNTNGYRLDNFKITGKKTISNMINPAANTIRLFISGHKLVLPDFPCATYVEIFNLYGSLVQTSVLNNGSTELNSNLKKGLYLVRVASLTGKILL